MDWELLWKIMLVVVLGLFAVMALMGTIFGARDIRRLLVHLKNPEEAEDSEAGDDQ